MAASTLCPTLAQESVRLLRRRGVETVILAGADTHGIMRGKRVPIAELRSCGRARHRVVRRHLGAAGRRGRSPSSRLRGTTAGSRATAIRTCSRCPTSRRPASSRGTTARRCCCATSSIATAAPSRCRRAPCCARWSIAPRPWASSRSSAIELEFYAAARDAAVGADEAPVAAAGGRGAPERATASSRPRGSEDVRRRGARRRCASTGSPSRRATPEAGPGQFEINVRAAPALRRPTRRSCSRARSRRSPRATGCWRRSWPSRARTGRAARATCTSACATARPPRCATSSPACWRGWPS